MSQPDVRSEEQPAVCRSVKQINLAMMIGIVGTVFLTAATPGIPSSHLEQSLRESGAIAQNSTLPLEAGVTVTGKLEDSSSTLKNDGSPYNRHTFEGKAGEQVAILLSSQKFDAYAILLGTDGQKLAEDDDSGGGTDALVVVTLPVNGIYTVLANAYDREARGEYQLVWRSATAADQSLAQAGKLAKESNQLKEQGRYAEAIPLAEQVLALRRGVWGENHPAVATSLNNLAVLYQEQGRYSEAEPLLQQALKIDRAALGENHPGFATDLNNLAYLYYSQRRYSEAEPLYQQALRIIQAALDETHPNVAGSLNNLAALYQAQGRYGEAEPLYRQVLSIQKAALGANHPDVATSLNNLALLYQAQGRYGEAEPLYQQALSIRQAALGATHPDVTTSLDSLASLYEAQGRYGEAEPLYRQVLSIRQAALGATHPDVAGSLNGLAALYDDQGRYSEAEPLYQQALSIEKAALGENHPYVATSLNNLAVLYQAQGRYSEAERLFLQALKIWQAALDETHPNVAASLNNLSGLDWAQGRLQSALKWLQQGLTIEEVDLNRNLIGGSESNKRDYLTTFKGSTDATLTLHLQYLPQNPTATQLALKTVLQRKGRLLDLFANSQQTLRDQLDSDSQALLDQLNQVHTQISNLYHNQPETRPQAQYQQQLDQLDEQSQQLEDQLSRRSATFRATTAPIDLPALQSLLPADGVLVEFSRYQVFDPKAGREKRFGEYHYAAYLLQADGKIIGIDLGAAATLDPLIADFSMAVRSPSVRVAQVKAAAQALDAVLMAPIRSHLGNQKHLLISPDGALNLIPFEALVDEGNQYLMENYTLTYLTSGRDLLRLQAQSQASSQQPPLLLADPIFNQPGEAIAQLPGHTRSIDLTQRSFPPLPETKTEVEAIAQLFPGAQLREASQATEAVVKQADRPRILHIATHGFFEPIAPSQTTLNNSSEATPFDNPLLRSGLVLAGFQVGQSSGEDGILTALEVSSLNLLGTQMVVLSACETGQGDLSVGEGVYGLRRSLVLAGSESQVISLWRVQDSSTKDLMVSYYEQLLQGKGRSEALRTVQLTMLKDERTAHPYYWAPFIQSGDWKPLQ